MRFANSLSEIIKHYSWRICHDIVAFVVYKVLANTKFNTRKRYLGQVSMNFPLGLSPHVVLMFLGVYEYPVRQLLNRHLNKGDTFLDIGANIGYFSALALNKVGPNGQVHAFEPDPRYFRYLIRLQKLNPKHVLTINNVAAGASRKTIKLIQTKELGTSTLVNDLRSTSEVLKTSQVKVIRLDTYLRRNKVNRISLIKIDVEGYEYDVLRGLEHFLNTTEKKPIIIAEVYPYAMAKQGYTLNDLQKWLSRYRYRAENNLELSKLGSSVDDMYNIVFYPSNNLSRVRNNRRTK